MSDEILVADDDPESRRAIADALGRAGHATEAVVGPGRDAQRAEA